VLSRSAAPAVVSVRNEGISARTKRAIWSAAKKSALGEEPRLRLGALADGHCTAPSHQSLRPTLTLGRRCRNRDCRCSRKRTTPRAREMMRAPHVLLPAQPATRPPIRTAVRAQRVFLRKPARDKTRLVIVAEVAKRLGFGAGSISSRPPTSFASTRRCPLREQRQSRFRHRRPKVSVGRRLDAMRRCNGRSAEAPSRRRGSSPRADFLPPTIWRASSAPEIPSLRTETTAARPLRLNTGRIRDQWHTMTRTGASPRLASILPEPFVEIHPDDALRPG